MRINPQDQMITMLEDKISKLKVVLETTIEKHSDAAYDLKDLKDVLEKLIEEKSNYSSEKMLVMANEWEDVQ